MSHLPNSSASGRLTIPLLPSDISGRRAEVVEKAAESCNAELKSFGGMLVPVQGDVSDKESLLKLAKFIGENEQKLHILVK